MKRIWNLDRHAPALQPGSPEALALGCACPAADQYFEASWLSNKGAFIADWNCPFHGLRALFENDQIVEDERRTDNPPGRKIN
jgi:hypothetical protein